MKTASEKPRTPRKPKEQVVPSLDWTEDQRRQIADLAYHRFLARGGEHGHAMEDWLAAEAEMAAALSSKSRRTSRTTQEGPTLVPPKRSAEAV